MKKTVRLIGTIKYFLKKSSRDNISAISAQSAFFLILSIVPFLMFAFAVLSFFNIPRSVYESYIQQAISPDVNTYLKGFIETAYNNSIGIAFTTIIAALWSAGKGIYSITEGINRIYKLKYKKFWIIKRLYAMLYTLLMFIVMVITVCILIVAEFFDELIKPYLKSLPYVLELLYTLRYLVAFTVMVLLMSLALKLYLRRKVKDKRWAKFRLQLPGVIITALSWFLFSFGMTIYIKFFNGFSIYGSLGTLAVVMIWIYFSMYILLYCIQFNYVNRHYFYEFSIRNLLKRIFRRKKVDK